MDSSVSRERQNLVSARVPSHFKCSLLPAAATSHQLQLRTVLRNSASYLIHVIFWFAGLNTSTKKKTRYRCTDNEVTCVDHKVVSFNFMYFHGLNVTNCATAWYSWLRHCATSRKIVSSIPSGVSEFFIDKILPTALWSWDITEMSTRNIS